jgi:hypothetical protein
MNLNEVEISNSIAESGATFAYIDSGELIDPIEDEDEEESDIDYSVLSMDNMIFEDNRSNNGLAGLLYVKNQNLRITLTNSVFENTLIPNDLTTKNM